MNIREVHLKSSLALYVNVVAAHIINPTMKVSKVKVILFFKVCVDVHVFLFISAAPPAWLDVLPMLPF